MIPQTHPLLAGWIQHFACLIDAVAAFREFVQKNPWRVHEFAAAVHLAVDKGIVSGDVNNDGDKDDPGEATVQDLQKLADHFGLPLKYLGKFDQKDYPRFTGPKYWVAVAWYNPRTKFIHWVIGNQKPVLWDSIGGGSVTVAEGYPYPLTKDKDGNLTGGIRPFEVV